MPIGRPSSFQNSGTLIAGWPLMLNGGVNGTNVAARRIPCSVGSPPPAIELTNAQGRLAERGGQQQIPTVGPPLLDRSPELGGGGDRVGVVDARGDLAGVLGLSPVDRFDLLILEQWPAELIAP